MKSTRLGISLALGLSALGAGATWSALASDHSDTPLLISFARHDARITDLYAFQRGSNLVLALCTDPSVPPGAATYVFPSDLRLEIDIDNDSAVDFEDPLAVEEFGGRIVNPQGINQDIKLKVRFEGGAPVLTAAGVSAQYLPQIQVFAGLRDDPFIRGPRIGRNVAAVVIELPLAAVLAGQDTLIVWATARAPGLAGNFQELAGRALRSQFPENDAMNTLDPRFHQKRLGVPPDVTIYDTSQPASFPNGRELVDDVVDLVGDPRVLDTDPPFPSANDVPFLDTFPYLAPPQ